MKLLMLKACQIMYDISKALQLEEIADAKCEECD